MQAASGHNNDGYEYDVIVARVDGYDDNFGYKANLYMQMGISVWYENNFPCGSHLGRADQGLHQLSFDLDLENNCMLCCRCFTSFQGLDCFAEGVPGQFFYLKLFTNFKSIF